MEPEKVHSQPKTQHVTMKQLLSFTTFHMKKEFKFIRELESVHKNIVCGTCGRDVPEGKIFGYHGHVFCNLSCRELAYYRKQGLYNGSRECMVMSSMSPLGVSDDNLRLRDPAKS